MKIFIEDYELVHSGVVIQIKNYPIKVTLLDKIEGDYTFIFNFINDNNEHDIITKYNSTDKYTLYVDFVNFDKSNYVGNNELIEVGTFRKDPLFLQYRVSSLDNLGYTLTFNFFVKKETQNAK